MVTESSTSKSYIEEMLHVRKTNYFYIYHHGVNVKTFSENNRYKMIQKHKEPLLGSLGLPKDLIEKLWIYFIEELSYYKGADVLIDAIEILKKRSILHKYKCISFLPREFRVFPDRYDLKNVYLQRLAKLAREGYVFISFINIQYDA
ncbi:MAG: hypothetical protein QXJ64_05960 [Thermosphaera sp.]